MVDAGCIGGAVVTGALVAEKKISIGTKGISTSVLKAMSASASTKRSGQRSDSMIVVSILPGETGVLRRTTGKVLR